MREYFRQPIGSGEFDWDKYQEKKKKEEEESKQAEDDSKWKTLIE